jgi:hypothetical protein
VKYSPKLSKEIIELLEKEGVRNLTELAQKHTLTIEALNYRIKVGIPLSGNTHTRKKKRPEILNGFKRGNQKKRDKNGEVKERVSLAFREFYDWPLLGAKEWVDKVKKVANIEMVQKQLRNKA